jgi:hypothetical protein
MPSLTPLENSEIVYPFIPRSRSANTTPNTTRHEYSHHQDRPRTKDFLAITGPGQQQLHVSTHPNVLLINRFRVQVPAGAPITYLVTASFVEVLKPYHGVQTTSRPRFSLSATRKYNKRKRSSKIGSPLAITRINA